MGGTRILVRASAVGIAAILSVVFAFKVDAAAPKDAAEAFIGELATRGTALLENADSTAGEREQEFRRVVLHGFALTSIGRFVVGRYWRDMTSDQQDRYQELFSEWMLRSHANRLGDYVGRRFQIVKSVDLDNRYGDVVVSSRVLSEGGAPTVVADWRVRRFGDEFKIIDVIVEGVSMAGAQKDEFETVIRKIGVEGLIKSLQSRLAELLIEAG